MSAGTIVVARYELLERIESPDAPVSLWHATDKIFNRPVTLFPVAEFPTELGEGALTRARETAQITVAGITRVLDVLDSGDTKVIVTEEPTGVNALTAISGATFLVDQARAVIGTIATTLKKASENGLGHGALGTSSIYFGGGKVTIDGIIARHILNANAGHTPEQVTAHDLRALSGLTYFMLTGLMPKYEDSDNDLPRLLTVIPNMTPSLELLSTGVLNGTHVAPSSYAEFLEQLGPWSPEELPVIDPAALAGITEIDEDTASRTTAIPAGAPVQRASIKSVLAPPPMGSTVPTAPATANRPAFGAFAPEQSQPQAPRPAALQSAPAAKKWLQFNPTALILILALVAVLLGGNWAYKTLTAGFDPVMISPTGRPTPTPTEGTEAGETEAPPEVVVLPVVKTAVSLDPQGDENEHPELQDLLIDGDSTSSWYSRTYRTAPFSNLKKGIGIELKLKEVATVSSVLLSSANKGGMVEIRATDRENPTKGDVLASGPLDGETIFTFAKPVKTESIVIWFTLLPQDKAGKNRIYLHEISVT